LSRDPRGTGRGGESAAPEAAFNAAAPIPPSESTSMVEASESPFGPASPTPLPKTARPQTAVEAPPKVEVARANNERRALPIADALPPATDDPKDVPPPAEEPRRAIAAPAQPPSPSPPQPPLPPAAVAQAKQSADPAPQTDSEVDPFSTLGSVE